MKRLQLILFIIFTTIVFHAESQGKTQKEAVVGAFIGFDSEGVSDVGVKGGIFLIAKLNNTT